MRQRTHGVSLRAVLERVFADLPRQGVTDLPITGGASIAVPATRTSEDRSRMRQKVLDELARRRRQGQPAAVGARIGAVSGRTADIVIDGGLFGPLGQYPAAPGPTRPVALNNSVRRVETRARPDVRELVKTAYCALMRRLPEDHVILNPIANAEFIVRCRDLGATVPEVVLNRTLLNNRKAKRHTDVVREPVASLEAGVFDQIGHAVEIAASLVQRESVVAGRGLPSVDDILCGPELRSSFGAYVRALYADVDIVNCHLVLLAYRKSGPESAHRLARVDIPEPLFTAPLGSLDPSDVPETCGFYRVLCKRKPIFVSGTANLRQRILRHLPARGDGFLPGSVPFDVDGPVSFQVFAAPKDWLPRRADAVARSMRIDEYPDLNWREKGALFADQDRIVCRMAKVG